MTSETVARVPFSDVPGTHPGRRIGGSDIPKLLGLSNYGDERDVYERIVRGRDAEWNPKMERGAAMEPVLRALGQQMLQLELETVESDYFAHPTYEFAGAQVDDLARWFGMPAAVDYKSVNRWSRGWGPEGSDEVPEHIRAQMTWELLCSGRELGLLVVGFGDDVPPPEMFHIANVVPYQIQRDEEFEAFCLSVAHSFWEKHVLPRVPPSTSGKRKKS